MRPTNPAARNRTTLRMFAAVAVLVAAACAARPSRIAGNPVLTPAAERGVNHARHLDAPYVVLISFDGFRPDYLDRFELPNFRRIEARGARARWMVPVFPSLTFPNHYSLVTGLYPGRHGIVANAFYDPARGRSYAMADSGAVSDGSWYRGEPIWVTAERQGMVAGCFFWPGSEATIRGVRPSLSRKYDHTIPNEQRVSTVLEWLRREPPVRPHLVTLYFSDVDSASHRSRLDAPDIERAAQQLDRSLGLLLDAWTRSGSRIGCTLC